MLFFMSFAVSNVEPSFNHLIRPPQHSLRNRHIDRLRGFEIYHQLKLRRLLHGQIGRLGALEESVHEICDAPVDVREAAP